MKSEFTAWQYCTAKRKIRRNNNINETIIFLMGGGVMVVISNHPIKQIEYVYI